MNQENIRVKVGLLTFTDSKRRTGSIREKFIVAADSNEKGKGKGIDTK